MEFLLASFAFLTLLALVTLGAAWAISAIAHLSRRLRSWWHFRRCSMRHATFQSDSMRRYALRKEPSPLGRLRFTKSRAVEFRGPNPYGYGPPRFPLEDDDKPFEGRTNRQLRWERERQFQKIFRAGKDK